MVKRLNKEKTKKEINADSLTIYEFLEESSIISIPRYQREYSWDKNNIESLMNDVHEGYYIGNIISFKQNKYKEIIDGQQRIITTFLILIAIMNETKDPDLKKEIELLIFNNGGCKLQLEGRIGSDGINLLNFIVDNNKVELDSVKNYKEVINYEYIKSKIKKNNNLRKFYSSFITANVVEISFNKKEISAHEMFVNVNTKGKPLMELEVLKSQLFKYLLASRHSDIYKEKWQEMLKQIPKNEYSTYVSNTYLFYAFKKNDINDTMKTNGTVKENFYKLLNIINNTQIAKEVFEMMTHSGKENIFCPFSAIKNHDLNSLQDNYYTGLNTSLSKLHNLWKLYGEYGFAQSDILFVSLFRDKETFVKNYVNYIYIFMSYVFLYEISRSIIGTSPANYSNSFKQFAKIINNEKDPNKIKKSIKGFIKTRKIETDKLTTELKKKDSFIKNYKNGKFIIMMAEGNTESNLTVEHFIPQKTSVLSDKDYIGSLGNLIPVVKDKYKNKSVEEKLLMYNDDAKGDDLIKNFLKYGFDKTNYKQKIEERTLDLADKFVGLINEYYNELIK